MTGAATIAAIATAAGSAERAVIRVSGPSADRIVERVCRVDGAPFRPESRGVVPARFDDGVGELPVLVAWMPGPRSFTAEDVAELHLPGHAALVQRALERLFELGARPAEPGEFTRRAFENGRIDLTQAEGVAALVAARSDAERGAALALVSGGLADRASSIRDALESVRALAEASLDFDEADTGHVPIETIESMATDALERVREAASWETQRLRDAAPPRVVLAGAPNAGKSTLFNRLAEGELVDATGPALVSDMAGTTRDRKIGDWTLDENGHRARLVDTAGRGGDEGRVRSRPDLLSEASTERDVASADLVLWVVDARDASSAERPPATEGTPVVLAWNRTDEPGAESEPPSGLAARAGAWAAISAATGDGLDALTERVREHLGFDARSSALGDSTAAPGPRHRHALATAAGAAEAALQAARQGLPLDLVAEELKLATDELDAIGGRTTPEDLLDRIFAQFCLGK